MKAIVLLSGGLDSAVAAAWARGKYHECLALSFRYGQRHKKELEFAKKLAEFYGMPWWILDVEIPGKSALTDHTGDLDETKWGLPGSFVPGRNMIFISFAASLAYELQVKAIVGGWNYMDNPGYPDCRGPFLARMEEALNEALGVTDEPDRFIFIDKPLIYLTKRGIIKMGRDLEVPFELTWSCYQGKEKPCGECSSCKFRAQGFKELKIKDPLLESLK